MTTIMAHARPHCAALVASEYLLDGTRRVLGGAQHCATPDGLRALLATGGVRVVVYETGVFSEAVLDSFIAGMSARESAPPVVACGGRGIVSLREAARIAEHVEATVLAHTRLDFEQSLCRSLAHQPQAVVAAHAIRHLAVRSRSATDPCVTAALMISDSRRTVADLQTVIGMGGRALRRHCQDAGLPRPVALLGWARSIHVVAAIERGQTMQDAALGGGEETSRDLGDYVRYHTGRAPTSWLRMGGTRAVLDAFANSLVARPMRPSIPLSFSMSYGSSVQIIGAAS